MVFSVAAQRVGASWRAQAPVGSWLLQVDVDILRRLHVGPEYDHMKVVVLLIIRSKLTEHSRSSGCMAPGSSHSRAEAR